MQKRMLVVVDKDAWVHRALADGADDFEIVECREPRAGLNACCALEPDCLLTGLRPGDRADLWLIETIRVQPGELGALPVVAIAPRNREVTPGSEGAEDSLRVQALSAGADVVLQKPLEVVEVIAQVRALLAMVARVRTRRRALPGPDGVEVFAGDLDHMPAGSILSTLELEHRSGEMVLTSRGPARRRLSLTIASGALVGGKLDATILTPMEAMQLVLGWEGGRFEFVPGPHQLAPAGATVGELLLETLHSRAPTTWRDLLDGVDLPEVRHREVSPQIPRPPALPSSRPPPPSHATSPAPGRQLVESVSPSMRPDPRAELDAARGRRSRVDERR